MRLRRLIRKPQQLLLHKGIMVILLVAELVMEWVPANDGRQLPTELMKYDGKMKDGRSKDVGSRQIKKSKRRFL
jgi:hypothetical protein